MSRTARKMEKKLPHHIMSRSIEELNLFNCEEDKERYLQLIEKSSKTYQIEVLAYCLMDNHVHILIHPRGGNISKFMKAINNPYAKYYNRSNNRRGHLFSERFKNIIIKDEAQLLRTSTYIHNNAKDLGYKSIEDYSYSSIKDYTRDGHGRGIAKPGYIFSIMGGGWRKAQKAYMGLLEIQSQGKEIFEQEMEKAFNKGNYETDRRTFVREAEAEKVIRIIGKLLTINDVTIRHLKYRKDIRKYKSILAISLRIFCGMTLKDMTKYFMNHTSATMGNLANEGYGILSKDQVLFDQLVDNLSV